MFEDTKLCTAKTILTIHNLRFQGIYNIPTIKYWTNLPNYVFEMNVLKENYTEANMLKGGLTYSNIITTVSHTYAYEIQTPYYGEHLDSHLRYHSGKLRGIVNGIVHDIGTNSSLVLVLIIPECIFVSSISSSKYHKLCMLVHDLWNDTVN